MSDNTVSMEGMGSGSEEEDFTMAIPNLRKEI